MNKFKNFKILIKIFIRINAKSLNRNFRKDDQYIR